MTRTPVQDPEEAIGDLDGARAGMFCLVMAFLTFVCLACASLSRKPKLKNSKPQMDTDGRGC